MKWTRSRDGKHAIYRALGITVKIGPVHSYFSVWHDATNHRQSLIHAAASQSRQQKNPL